MEKKCDFASSARILDRHDNAVHFKNGPIQSLLAHLTTFLDIKSTIHRPAARPRALEITGVACVAGVAGNHANQLIQPLQINSVLLVVGLHLIVGK